MHFSSLSAVAHLILVCDQARVLAVCAANLLLPLMRGIVQLHCWSYARFGGWGGGESGQILLAQNFASTRQTQKAIIILLLFFHKEIFSTLSDKWAVNVLPPLLSSWETLFLSLSPVPPRKQLQQQQCLIHYCSLERNSSSAPGNTLDAVKRLPSFWR